MSLAWRHVSTRRLEHGPTTKRDRQCRAPAHHCGHATLRGRAVGSRLRRQRKVAIARGRSSGGAVVCRSRCRSRWALFRCRRGDAVVVGIEATKRLRRDVGHGAAAARASSWGEHVRSCLCLRASRLERDARVAACPRNAGRLVWRRVTKAPVPRGDQPAAGAWSRSRIVRGRARGRLRSTVTAPGGRECPGRGVAVARPGAARAPSCCRWMPTP